MTSIIVPLYLFLKTPLWRKINSPLLGKTPTTIVFILSLSPDLSLSCSLSLFFFFLPSTCFFLLFLWVFAFHFLFPWSNNIQFPASNQHNVRIFQLKPLPRTSLISMVPYELCIWNLLPCSVNCVPQHCIEFCSSTVSEGLVQYCHKLSQAITRYNIHIWRQNIQFTVTLYYSVFVTLQLY